MYVGGDVLHAGYYYGVQQWRQFSGSLYLNRLYSRFRWLLAVKRWRWYSPEYTCSFHVYFRDLWFRREYLYGIIPHTRTTETIRFSVGQTARKKEKYIMRNDLPFWHLRYKESFFRWDEWDSRFGDSYLLRLIVGPSKSNLTYEGNWGEMRCRGPIVCANMLATPDPSIGVEYPWIMHGSIFSSCKDIFGGSKLNAFPQTSSKALWLLFDLSGFSSQRPIACPGYAQKWTRSRPLQRMVTRHWFNTRSTYISHGVCFLEILWLCTKFSWRTEESIISSVTAVFNTLYKSLDYKARASLSGQMLSTRSTFLETLECKQAGN